MAIAVANSSPIAATGTPEPGALDIGTLKKVLMARVASAGATGVTRAVLRRDLLALVEQRLSPAQWRYELDVLLLDLVEDGLVQPNRARVTASELGCDSARRLQGAGAADGVNWQDAGEVELFARALGPEAGDTARRRRLADALSVRGAVLEAAFGIKARVGLGPRRDEVNAGRAQSVAPELAAFAHAVNSQARAIGEGWLGSRRAFIARVWQRLIVVEPQWPLSIEAFKDRLVEAHREGLVVLATADLRDRSSLAEVQQSAVRYKNTEWHFIRVEN